MHYRVNTALTDEIARFGGETLTRCFNCGNCSAVCGLSKGDTVFPRKTIRFLQLGLEDRLVESPEPWLCYYCGTCSQTCPREAQPGELMMATRRWLTTRYDVTGLSRRLYLSDVWEVGLLAITALVVLAFFVAPRWLGVSFGFAAINAEALAHVRLDLFAPKELIHYGDWTLAAMLALMLGMNALRMVYFIRRGWGARRVPLSIWLGQLPALAVHGVTQRRWLECDNDTRMRWLQHFLLVSGYATMFVLVVAFLRRSSGTAPTSTGPRCSATTPPPSCSPSPSRPCAAGSGRRNRSTPSRT